MRLALALSLLAFAAAGCADPAGRASGSSGSGSGESLPAVVAEVAGISITAEEMTKAMAAQEYQQRRELHQMREQWLQNELIERMLQREASKESLTVEQLLERVDATAKLATDADAQMFYKVQSAQGRLAGKDGKTPPFEELKDRIKQHLTEQSKGSARQQYFAKLMDGSELKIHLSPPDPPQVAVSTDNDPAKGPADAKVTVIEFSDFQCPACRQAHFALPQLFEKYGDRIRFVYRDFPLLGKHPDALPAAVAAQCAGDQGKYWDMHDNLFKAASLKDEDFKAMAGALSLDMEKFNACLKDPAREAEVRKDLDDGRAYGVNSTPTFYVNGYLVVGANMAELGRLIDRELGKGSS